MVSDSARATSAAESRFRVQAPNSLPRRILVVALDPLSALLGHQLAERRWCNIHFANFETVALDQTFSTLEQADLSTFDSIVIVGTAGRALDQADHIAERCFKLGIEVSAVLIASKRSEPKQVRDALLKLRPASRMLTVVRDGELLSGMLQALGN